MIRNIINKLFLSEGRGIFVAIDDSMKAEACLFKVNVPKHGVINDLFAKEVNGKMCFVVLSNDNVDNDNTLGVIRNHINLIIKGVKRNDGYIEIKENIRKSEKFI